MSILNTLLLISILTLSPLTHALEEALGTPTTVTSSPIAVPIAQADSATLLEAALQLREAKPALFEGAKGVLIVNVVPDSQAAEKGLQPGDIVIAYAGEAMNSVDQLIKAAKVSEAQVVLRFIRGKKVEEVGLRGGWVAVELKNIEQDFSELDRLNKEGEQAYSQSNYPLAIKKWQVGLDQARKLAYKRYISAFLGKLGMVYDDLGQYYKALEYHEGALAIHREFGDKYEERNDLKNLGVVYWNLSQYFKSLEYHQQSLAIYRELGDKRGEVDDLTDLGVVYWNLDKYPKSLEHDQQNQQILDIKRALVDKHEIGNNLANVSLLYKDLGQYDKALEYGQQALAIDKALGDKHGEGSDLAGLGVVYWNLGQYPKSLEYYQQALAIHRELGDKREEAHDLGNIGVVYGYLGQYDKAKTHFQNSVTIWESLSSLDNLWKAQGGLSATEVHLKQPKEAIQHYEQALDIIEQLRAGLTGGIETATGLPARTLKTDFMQNKFFVYDELINLYYDQGGHQKAFEAFERKQGRAFLEDMAHSGGRRYVDLPVEISLKEEALETQVGAARKILEAAAGKGDEAVKSAREQLTTAETAQRTFQAKLKVKYPRYYDLKHPQPVKLPNLQQNILQDGELLLIYNVREEATDLWLVGKQHFQMFSLPLTEAQVKEQVEAFRKWGIDRADTDNSQALADSLEKNFTDFTQASQALYQQLFPATVRTLLGEAKPKRLYIVPTSALYELPFEALVTENTDKPHYLLQDYAISYLSSASLLKTLRDAKQRRGTAQRQPLLAFADPVYPPCSDTTTQTISTEESLKDIQTEGYLKTLSTDCFEPLPVSGQEARAIAELLEVEEDSQPLPLQLGEDAAKSTVLQFNDKQWLDNYRYILFSTHAILPNEVSYIQQPAIVLSHQQAGEDGFLTMDDVFGLSLNTDLVILSACNTGRGETIKGEGTIGLTRAFMYAGTPAVSITLWSIEALAAKKLNVAWFTRLKEGQPLADSLREAKLEMLDKSGYYRYPYAWAGVVVFGDGK